VKKLFYVFFLQTKRSWFGGKNSQTYTMNFRNMAIEPIQFDNKNLRHHTTHVMTSSGLFEQIQMTKHEKVQNYYTQADQMEFEVKVLSTQCTEPTQPAAEVTEKNFKFEFEVESYDMHHNELEKKLLPLRKAKHKADVAKKPFLQEDLY
jgi:hypothetical protein